MYYYAVRTGCQEGAEIGDRHHRRADRPPQHASADRRRGHATLDPRAPAQTSTRQRFPIKRNIIIIIISVLCISYEIGGGYTNCFSGA